MKDWSWRGPLGYAAAAGLVLVAALATQALTAYTGRLIFALYYPAVLLSAWLGGLGPGLAASLLSAVVIAYISLPRGESLPQVLPNIVLVGTFLLVALLIVLVIERRRQSEAAIRESDERFRLLVQGVTDYAIFMLDPQGRVISWNTGAERLKGYTRDDILGQHFSRFYTEEDRQRGLPENGLRQAAAKGRFEAEGWRVRKDGSLFWANVVISALRDETGRLLGFAKVTRDLTERRRAEAAVRELNVDLERRVIERTAQLQMANRDLEAFTYSVSHDLRAPLRAIAGFGQLLAERNGRQLDEESQRFLDNILEAAAWMDRLIQDLLTYARVGRQGVQAGPVALATILHQMVRDLGPQIRGAQITIAPDLPSVHGDPTLLRQVFANLLENALIYRRPGVPLQLSVEARVEAGTAVVCVADNGIGIPAEHQTRIFDLFQRLHTEQEFPGSGIGLATVKKAVDLLGGEVWVESREGAGSSFYVRLPLAEASLAEPEDRVATG